MEFLDQLAFQQERFVLVADGMHVKVVDRIDQRIELEVPTHSAGGMEILADPLAQIASFANVNHSPEAVLHEVNARFMRQLAQLIADLVRYRHTLLCQGMGRSARCSAVFKGVTAREPHGLEGTL